MSNPPDAPRLPRRRRISFIVIIILIAFAALELGLRVIVPRAPAATPYEIGCYTREGACLADRTPSLRIRIAPFTIFEFVPGQRTDRVTINSMGFRGDELSDAGRARVVVVGGSSAFGLALPSDATSIPAQLQMRIDREVVNAGVPGFLSGQELALVTTRILDLEPEIILAYDGWNDLFDAWFARKRSHGEFGFGQHLFAIEDQLADNHRTQASVLAALRRSSGALLMKSVLLRPLGRMLLRTERGSSGDSVIDDAQRESYYQEILATYLSNILKMRDICRARNIRFFVAIQPEVGQKSQRSADEETALHRGIGPVGHYDRTFPELYRRFRADCRRSLSEMGIEHVDIADQPAFTAGTAADHWFVDVVHTNPKGNEVIATILAQALTRSG